MVPSSLRSASEALLLPLIERAAPNNEQRPEGGIVLAGNHDPLTPNSIYASGDPFRRALPGYVHVVDSDEFELPLGSAAVVYARPCRSHAGQTGLAASLPARADGDERIRIGLIHGQTFDLEDHQTTFPIERNAAVERGLDYLAIGDTHGYRDVEPDAKVPTIYPGAPEATKFGETDPGHVAVVFFPRDRARRALVDREAVAAWSWREETCRSLAELRRLRDGNMRNTVLRLTLDTRLPLHEYDEAARILTERAADDPEKAERALHHLYRLVREP